MFLKKSAYLAVVLLPITSVASVAMASDDVQEVYIEGRHLSMDKMNAVKAPTPILDVPQSLSIYSAEQIKEQGIKSIGDMIDYTAGVNTSQGEGHRDAVVFRGVRSTADFFVDGARDDVQYYRPLYNVEQVEILRGPNALLFGRGGTGGVLNRVTKKGQIGEEFTAYTASVDTFGEYELSIDNNMSLSDSSAFRLNAYVADLANHRDFYDGERYGLNPTVRFQLSPETRLDLSYEYIKHDRFIDRGIPTGANGEPVAALDDIVFGDPDLNKTELEAHVYRANLDHKFSDHLKGSVSAFYGDYDKLYQNFYASDYDANLNTVELDGYVDTTDRENVILSGNLIGEFSGALFDHTLLVGAEFIDTSSNQDRYNAFFDVLAADRAAEIAGTGSSEIRTDQAVFAINRPINFRGGVGVLADGRTVTNQFGSTSVPNADVANPNILNDDTRVDIQVSSFYIQDQIELTSWVDLVLGARFDSFDIKVNNVDASSSSFGLSRRTDEEVSPRAGIIIKPQENISIYASYSESFLPRSGEQYANINGDNDELDPDVFESSELGFKWDINKDLSFTAAYFENEQTRADRDNVTGEAFEIRGLEVEGFELQLQGQLSDSLSFVGNYSHFDGETGSGADPRELPENMFSFWSNFDATDNFGLGLGVVYQDESLISDGGSETLPSYTRVDAAAYYDVSDKVRLQLNIENLFDEAYFPNAHSTHQVTVGAPVNALFTISGKL